METGADLYVCAARCVQNGSTNYKGSFGTVRKERKGKKEKSTRMMKY